MLADLVTAPISEADRALFSFVEQMNRASWDLKREHIDAVVAAGWSEEAVYDAITVCALFNFYNRWCDAAGVHAMAHADHTASGARMAQHGYLPPQANVAAPGSDGSQPG